MPLQDTDNFIVGRDTDSYKISYEDLKDDLNFVPAPQGKVATPTVLEPYDGAGLTRYPLSDVITDVTSNASDSIITVASTDELDDLVGEVFMTDGAGEGPYQQTNYELTTTTVSNVDSSNPSNVVLTFPGDTSTNPDLQYFRTGDVIAGAQVEPGDKYEIRWGGSSVSSWYGATPRNNFVEFGQRPSSGSNSVRSMYYDVGKAITNVVVVRYAGSKEGGSTKRLYGINDPLSTDWELLHESKKMNGPNDFPYEEFTNGNVPYRYFRLTDGTDMDVRNIGIDDNIFNNQTTVVETGYANGNNTMTVNGGSWNIGDVITLPVSAGIGDVTDITNTTITITPRSGRFIGPNIAGIDFALAGPAIIETPLLTNEVDLRSSDFAVEPGSNDDVLEEIIWDIDGTEYSAGTSNPWKPLSNLSPNTTHTVRVKHIGVGLGESEWSPSISFTTGATLRSLFDRIAAIEADEISDDATDSALLTLIANLTARVQALEESN